MKGTGFATPVALGFALLLALLASSALHDATLARALSTTRLLHQRAFAAGEFGLAQVAAELNRGEVVPGPRSMTLLDHPTDSVETQVAEIVVSAMPAGYSAGRVVEHHFEVRSIGSSARGARVVQVQGQRRLEPVGLEPRVP